MKKTVKTVALLGAVVMTFSAVPCAFADAAASAVTSASKSASSSASTSQTVKYGKVTAINGNKITLALGTLLQGGMNGTPPEMPAGGQQGTPPEMPSGGQQGTPPEMPAGGQQGTPPEKPSGDQQGTPPQKPDGDGKGAGNGFTESGKSVTLTLSSNKLLTKNGKSAEISDIKVGDILKLTYNSGGKISGIEILSTEGMGKPGGQGSMGSTSMELSAKYTVSSGSKKITSKTITDSNTDENAVLVTGGGKFALTDVNIKKTGDTSSEDGSNFYGLNAAVAVQADSTAVISGGKIVTDSDGSNAVFATGENARVTVTGTTIYTKGNSSRGLDATYGGTVTGSDLVIKTLGAHCAPLATDRGGGTVTVSDSKLYSSGDGSPCIYSTGDISAASCTGKATGAQIAVVEGKNSITLDKCTLIGAGKNGVMLYQSTSGDADVGTAVFSCKNSALKTTSTGPMFYITNTDAVINLENTKLVFSSGVLIDTAGNNTNNWGKEGENGGNVTLNATKQTLKGDITCDSISSAEINLTKGSSLTGAIDTANTGDVSVTLDSISKWNVTADSYVTAITNADATYSNIISNGHTIYYSSSDSRNSALCGRTVTLSDGGRLVPVK
ncbi:MAG: hypothetical protein IJ149_03065 [Oscillospiraceae bacterium]|nr:hypothetical protein [Oscillospiraceae bacterium]